jgi:hypothetical protein
MKNKKNNTALIVVAAGILIAIVSIVVLSKNKSEDTTTTTTTASMDNQKGLFEGLADFFKGLGKGIGDSGIPEMIAPMLLV